MHNFDLSPAALNDRPPMDPLAHAFASRDGDTLTMVREALGAGHARLAFQPVVTAQDNGVVAFYEGLIRVLDQGGRIIPAAQFMPQIEEIALGREIDCTTLGLGFDMLHRNPQLRLSLNVSARSIGDGKWRQSLDGSLRQMPHLGERLILEISESSAMLLHENVIRFMEEMQPHGIAFALDGFGAGFTAFRHLKDFFFDIVKIDKGFIRNIDSSPDNQVLAEALITVGRQFEMFTVADGVETAAEAAVLQSLQVDCLQGYFFGGPRFDLSR